MTEFEPIVSERYFYDVTVDGRPMMLSLSAAQHARIMELANPRPRGFALLDPVLADLDRTIEGWAATVARIEAANEKNINWKEEGF